MICPNCGNRVEEQDVFCEYCGTELRRRRRKKPYYLWAAVAVAVLSGVLAGGYILIQKHQAEETERAAYVRETETGSANHTETKAERKLWTDTAATAGTELPEETEPSAGTELPEETEPSAGTELPTETEASAATEAPATENRLMSDVSYDEENNYVFGSAYRRDEIVSITFRDKLINVSGSWWDVSANGDGSVTAWVTPAEDAGFYDLYIGGEGGVTANGSCEKLFGFYKNLKNIAFNGCFFTEQVTNMRSMFYGCENLEALDVSGFSTKNVRSMRSMFNRCRKLKTLDLSGFHTEQVTDMANMFNRCESLRDLRMGRFDTAQVRDMESMFYQCGSLERLDLRHFDMSRVENAANMLDGVRGVIER